MPEFLTYDRTLALLREVIAEFGADYVYPKLEPEAAGDRGVVMECFEVQDEQDAGRSWGEALANALGEFDD